MSDDRITVTGLNELLRALRHLDKEFPKQLRGHLKGIAERVAEQVRAKLPRVSGHMAENTTARATQKSAGISWRNTPYAGPVEFGGYPSGREYVAKGRYIFPTVEAERSEIELELEAALVEVIDAAGLG